MCEEICQKSNKEGLKKRL